MGATWRRQDYVVHAFSSHFPILLCSQTSVFADLHIKVPLNARSDLASVDITLWHLTGTQQC